MQTSAIFRGPGTMKYISSVYYICMYTHTNLQVPSIILANSRERVGKIFILAWLRRNISTRDVKYALQITSKNSHNK